MLKKRVEDWMDNFLFHSSPLTFLLVGCVLNALCWVAIVFCLLALYDALREAL